MTYYTDDRYPGTLISDEPVRDPVGTDQCNCVWPPGSEYPACPHDIRGPKGDKWEPEAARV